MKLSQVRVWAFLNSFQLFLIYFINNFSVITYGGGGGGLQGSVVVYKEVWWSIRRCGGLQGGVVVYKEVWWSF